MLGYVAASVIAEPHTGDVIVERNEEIDEAKARVIVASGIDRVYVRSPLVCRSRFGICRFCYGRDLARRELVKQGTAIGVIAAQSIGEPGTQLTLRTFHTGGVVGTDITSGLPRVEELFEARVPRSSAVVSDISGVADVIGQDGGTVVRVTSSESYLDEYVIPPGVEIAVENGQSVSVGAVLFQTASSEDTEERLPQVTEGQPVVARVAGQAVIEGRRFYIKYEEREEREYPIPLGTRLLVKSGQLVKVGQQLTEGVINPRDILHIMGKEATQQYLVDEIQKVYCSQGVKIHDKHIAVIVSQMLRKVKVSSSGDTELLPGELIDRFDYEDINGRVLAEGGDPATAQAVLLGITRASLSKESWLAAASFQETGRVLTDATTKGKTDVLRGLKENVLLGKLIPARVLREEEVRKREKEELAEPVEEEVGLPPVEEPTELLDEAPDIVAAFGAERGDEFDSEHTEAFDPAQGEAQAE